MIRSLTAMALLLSTAGAPLPQELKVEVLDKLKSATVYIKASDGTGSGFVFLKRGTTAYIMTCEHVVERASTVKVVFRSGTTVEKEVNAKVVATDPSRDIACLIVRDVTELPEPLDLGQKTEVKETESVFVAGFPFGALLSGTKRNPEISVSRSSVSSIRRNEARGVAAVQISGEVNPGNSGGPLVTSDGRVVGVTAAKIRGTQTAFAVPSEEIQGFLKGRVKASAFRKVEANEAKARYEIKLDLVDPLQTLKGVGITWIAQKKLTETPAAEKDGTWKKVDSSMETVDLEVDEDRAQGMVDFLPEGKEAEFAIVFQCFHVQSDGKTAWTEPVTQRIEFRAGPEGARGGRGGKDGPKEIPPADPDNPGEEPEAADSGPKIRLTLPDSIPLAAEVKGRSVWGGMALAPDGSALYALDLAEGQVFKLDSETLKVVARIDVHEWSVAMALSPGGNTLYVGGRAADSSIYDGDRKANRGRLQAIDTAKFKTTSRMELKGAIVELVATDSGRVAASCIAQWSGLIIVDMATQFEESVQSIYGGASLRLSKDQKRVYIGDHGISPADFRCLLLEKDGDRYTSYDSVYHGEHPLGGSFELSPDGRHLIGSGGSILRLGRTRKADLNYIRKIEPFVSAGVAAGSDTLFIATGDGFIKSFSLEDFSLQKSVKFGSRIERMALDPKRRRMYVQFTESEPSGPGGRQSNLGRIAAINLGAP